MRRPKFLKHKINQNSNFLISDKFSAQSFNQTDFGHLYFNTPSQVFRPQTTEELAATLKQLNSKGTPVTVRNTGHSTNGQTLTGGVQVEIGDIKHLFFDEKSMEVTAGAGNTWDEVLKVAEFPRYCLPVFPNNPGQQIKIGGTAAVGGIGPYSYSHGGFWNHIVKIKLVTMTGEIVICSDKENPDLFKFALGGFGRIGIVSELTIRLIPSKPYVLAAATLYHDQRGFEENLNKAIGSNLAGDGVFTMHLPSVAIKGIWFIREIDKASEAEAVADEIRHSFHSNVAVYLNEGPGGTGDISFNSRAIHKKEIVYFYPTSKHEDQLTLSHPWSDFILPPSTYHTFMDQAQSIVKSYGLDSYLIHQPALHGYIEPHGYISYVIRKLSGPNGYFPLSLDLPDSEIALSVGVMPTVPPEKVRGAIRMTKDLTDLAFSLNGKRYLYSLHHLTKEQVEKQFGRQTIQQWQKIKDQLDPKHLLNIGVIEHLD